MRRLAWVTRQGSSIVPAFQTGTRPVPNVQPVKQQVRIVRVTPEHSGVLAEFFRKVWSPGASADSVRVARAADAAANPAVHGGDTPTYVFMRGEDALGYVTTIPIRLWISGSERIAYWVKGLMVLPEHRSGPIGVLLTKELMRWHHPLLASTVPVPAGRLFEALGFRSYGSFPTAIRILDAGEVLRRLDPLALGLGGSSWIAGKVVRLIQRTHLSGPAGQCARLGAATLTVVAAPSTRALNVTIGDEPGVADMDRLWAGIRNTITAGAVRDAASLMYRYSAAGQAPYTPIVVREHGGSLAGMAYVKHPRRDDDPRLRGLHVATLSDIVCDARRKDVMSALLAGAERAARDLGGHALMSSATVTGLFRVQRERAWMPLPATLHFYAHDPNADLKTASDLGQWWLTRGDGGSDGGL